MQIRELENYTSSVEEDLIRTYRGWKKLEGEVSPIDIDVAPELSDEYRFANISAVDQLLSTLQKRVSLGSVDGELIAAKIRAARAYIHARGIAGQRVLFSLDDYCQVINGYKPKPVSNSVIERQQDKVGYMFRGLDPTLKREGFNLRGWRMFFEKYGLDEEGIRGEFLQTRERLVPVLREFVGDVADNEVTKNPRFVSVNESWAAWFGMDPDNPRQLGIRINTHNRHHQVWSKGTPELFCAHENAHALQTASMLHRWRMGLLGNIHLITLVPGPAQYHFEGMAINMPYLVPGLYDRVLSDFGRFVAEYKHLYWLVYSNAMIDMNSVSTLTMKERRQKVQYFLPAESDERVAKELKALGSDPVSRGYTPAYSEGGKDFRRIAEKLDDTQKADLLMKLLSKQMTYAQIQVLFKSYSV